MQVYLLILFTLRILLLSLVEVVEMEEQQQLV